ncbi:hemerythrin domain-containing protein [Sphingomonas immobilis]|uniref:Hemerythrin domain-containing protein n=1 Tax=Sphingomonas immobilis TaxID=3063997 RepID=A0ABT8ZWJ7_9SPHN|nr:hemerythrin domain-containing protein [Sphingomonas sp. CA1-15]MDO7841951.1 hemerythrin domain-containing protein [Sphingomonas sp. CA1-15]
MSLIDKVVSAVTPPESEKARVEARAKAQAAAQPGSWLSQILGHHREIEDLFDAVKIAETAVARRKAQQELALLLTGHSIAEEAAVYPALAADKQVGHAELAYQEQSAAKMEMGLLERLDPLSEDYLDKLEHIRGAVAHHVYSEEGTWFLKLAESADAEEQARITARYDEEFERYTSGAH